MMRASAPRRPGAYDSCSVASLTIVVPWYRHCQMERTSRWTVTTGKWDNGAPDGEPGGRPGHVQDMSRTRPA